MSINAHIHRHKVQAILSLQIQMLNSANYHCSSHLAINKAIYPKVISLDLSSIQISAYDFIEVLSMPYLSQFRPFQSLSPSKPDPTDPGLFLSVLLSADLTVEEMFCLILKCEEICGQSAKSHYSPTCSAALQTQERGKNASEREEEMFILPQTDE